MANNDISKEDKSYLMPEAAAFKADRDEVKEKIRELLEAQYAELEAAAERIAPDFDFEAEAEELETEEEQIIEQLNDAHIPASPAFAWAEDEEKKRSEEEAARMAEAEALYGPQLIDESELDKEAALLAEAEAVETETALAEEPEAAPDEPTEESEPEVTEEPAETAEAAPAEAETAEPAEPAEKPLPPALVSPSKYPKPRSIPKTAFGRAVFRDRHSMALTAALILSLAAVCYQCYDYFVPKTVGLAFTTYDGTQNIEYKTTSRTVGALLDELTTDAGPELSAAGIEITEQDVCNAGDDIPVSNDLEIEILHASEVQAKIKGEKTKIHLVPGTVAENLALNDIPYDDDDEISPALDKQVDEKTKLVVDEVHYNVREKKETVEAESKVILDPSLASGVQQREEGNDGEGIFKYTTRYVNGKKDGTKREVKEWITEPHDHMLRLGTSATGNSGTYRVVRTFTANCTAYTAKSGARGALGERVHYGTCAVDPSYVSYRSQLWIDGYGYAYANDCGGAVKGNVVDLYMNSRSACIQWGRRNRTAYVLQPVD